LAGHDFALLGFIPDVAGLLQEQGRNNRGVTVAQREREA
jgi:hypothetical protein